MAESRREASQIVKEAGKPGDHGRDDSARDRNPEPGSPAAQFQDAQHRAERLAGLGQEGIRRAADASTAAASGAVRSGSAVAESAQEIANAWVRYAEEVVRHTSEASRALLRARTFSEMLEVQAKLMRDNMQAFLDQSVRVAESAGRLAKRPFEAVTKGGSDQTRR
jgi:hypothetical protein